MRFEWIVALRFLREGRMQTALIVLAVTIGVAVIVFLTALITGLQTSLIARTLGSQAHVVIRPLEELSRPVLDRSVDDVAAVIEKRVQRLRSIDQWESIYASIERMPGVVAASPMVSGPAFALRGTASKSIAILGVDAERYKRIVRIEDAMVAGQFRLSGTETVIGVELANDLGVAVGDKVRLQTPEGRTDVLTVVGIFDIGTKELNRRWVFTTMRLAQNLLNLPGGVSNIDLAVGEIYAAETIARRIAAEASVQAESWMTTNAQLLTALRNQTMNNRLIRGFVILIVALGIASVLVVSVVQKQKEIGILRAMGTSPRRIMAVFLLQGGLVALAGSLLGSVLAGGLVFGFSVLFRNADGSMLFAPELDPVLFVSAWVVATLTGVVSAVVPARRAARLDPVAAIRG